MKHRLLTATLVGVALVVGATAGFFVPRDDDFFALRKSYEIFGAIYEELVTGYVDELEPEKLLRSGVDAMLHDLDPYTTFYDEADNADIEIITRGRYGGVGLNLGVRGGRITVISPVEGASGYKQGVRAGDVVTHVAGRSTDGLSPGDLRELMRGEPGTAVEIVVEREGEPEPLSFLLTREDVKLKNVPFSGFVGGDTLGGIGYIKLERFARESDVEVRTALREMQQSGELRGLVLDLRDNLGGLLDAAVTITELFVPQGSVIVSTRGRLPQTERVYRSQRPPIAPDLPLVVLINEPSASASEIVAGAIQDLDRGVIVGMPSFGKGLVQVVKPLKYNTSLKMTTSRYYTPSGRSIQAIDYRRHDGNFEEIPDSLRRAFTTQAGRTVLDGRGIEPDAHVSMGAESQLEEALIRRAAFFFFANHFAATTPEIGPDFGVDDAVYADFRAWLDDQGFTYRTDAERTVEDLAEELAAVRYADADDEIEALRREVLQAKAQDFERYSARLRERLRTEILARYFGASVQAEASLAQDPQFAAAVRLLRDEDAYAGVLTP